VLSKFQLNSESNWIGRINSEPFCVIKQSFLLGWNRKRAFIWCDFFPLDLLLREPNADGERPALVYLSPEVR
jgi:hypothetical protein